MSGYKWLCLENLSFELGFGGWGGGINKNDGYDRKREQNKQRQGDMRQGQGFLKDIRGKVDFMNENRGKPN